MDVLDLFRLEGSRTDASFMDNGMNRTNLLGEYLLLLGEVEDGDDKDSISVRIKDDLPVRVWPVIMRLNGRAGTLVLFLAVEYDLELNGT